MIELESGGLMLVETFGKVLLETDPVEPVGFWCGAPPRRKRPASPAAGVVVLNSEQMVLMDRAEGNASEC